MAVSSVRSQGPPTQTKKGARPQRRNDNPDVGLPSGKDVPDGRNSLPGPAPGPAGPAPAPVGRNNGAPAGGRRNDNPDRGLPSGRDVPDNRNRGAPPPANGGYPPNNGAPKPVNAAGGAPPPANGANSAPPKAAGGRRNDNPDYGLPSGRDYPDNGRTRTRSGPPPPSMSGPAPAKAAGGRRNDNPDWGLPSGRDYPDAGLYNAAPAVPAAPAQSCDFYCQYEGYRPVCTIYGNEYDNDCYRACRNEPRECENACPCNSNAAPVEPIVGAYGGACSHCYAEEHSPVCVDGEETMYNECLANCEGKFPTCTSACPCT